MRNWEGRRQRRKTVFEGRNRKNREEVRGGRGAGWGRSRGDEGVKKGGFILWGRIQASLCASTEPEQRGRVLSAIKPMLHVCWCAQPISYGCICVLPRSWQLEMLAWDQTLDEASVVIHIMLGSQRNKRYQGNPGTLQICTVANRSTETHTHWSGVWFFQSHKSVSVAQYEDIITKFTQWSKKLHKRSCTVVRHDWSQMKKLSVASKMNFFSLTFKRNPTLLWLFLADKNVFYF